MHFKSQSLAKKKKNRKTLLKGSQLVAVNLKLSFKLHSQVLYYIYKQIWISLFQVFCVELMTQLFLFNE